MQGRAPESLRASGSQKVAILERTSQKALEKERSQVVKEHFEASKFWCDPGALGCSEGLQNPYGLQDPKGCDPGADES